MQSEPVEAPHFRIIPRQSDRLAIFFTGSSAAPGQFHFYGQAQRCEASAVLLNNGANHWYQSGVPGLGDLNGTIATLRSIAADLGARQIYCVGASMGGSGAVLYGALLKAKALAFGFETRLDLEGSRSRKLKAPGYSFPIPDMTPILGDVDAYIGASDAEDLFATAHTRDRIRLTALRGVRHGPPSYLRSRDRLTPLVTAFLNDQPLPAMPEAVEIPEGFPEALHEAHCGYWTGDVARWEAGAREAARLNPDSDMAHYHLGRALLKQGRHADALGYLSTALSLGNMREAAFYMGHALRHLGLYREAIAQHQVTARRWPSYPLPWRDMGLAWAAMGKPDKASICHAKAAELGYAAR